MGIRRRYRNFVEKFLSKDKGKRFFQFFYSWGAAIVIIGALAKLMHWPYNLGNILLTVGLLTEFLVFFISAFDTPPKDYAWEDVFPVLGSKDPEDRPEFRGNGNGNGSGAYIGGNGEGTGGYAGGGMAAGGPVIIGNVSGIPGDISPVATKQSFGIPSHVDISEEDTNALTASIKKLTNAADQLEKMAELTDATQQYLEKLNGMAENMDKFSSVTSNLTEVSDVLLNSYKNITGSSDELNDSSTGYVQQMDSLNKNIANLNHIFEIQIQSINSQMDAISRINAGLLRMKDMYEGSVMDSTVFRSESEKMTHHIAALNSVYARLLNAMTMNMNMQAGGYNPNPGYNPPPYNPSPVYNPNPGYGQNPAYTNPNPGQNP